MTNYSLKSGVEPNTFAKKVFFLENGRNSGRRPLLPVGTGWIGLNHSRIHSRQPGGNWIREHEHNTSDYHDVLPFKGEIFAVGDLHIARRLPAPISGGRRKAGIVPGRIPEREPVRMFLRGAGPEAVDAGGRVRRAEVKP